MYKFNYNYPQIARDSGFALQQFKDGQLDWRLIGSLETERIVKDQSFEPIESILFYLSEAPLGMMLDSNVLDSGVAKYFTLSQFSIQYLLFCRKFLDETVRTLRESLVEAQTDNGKLRKSLTEANNEVVQLHKKITQMEAIREVVFPCHICTKNFLTNDALNIHLSRKHSTAKVSSVTDASSPQSKERPSDRSLINTIKLELEIKRLKERLNIAEKEIRERSLSNSHRSTPRKLENDHKLKQTRNVGIQNNLEEIKEKDEGEAEVQTDEVAGQFSEEKSTQERPIIHEASICDINNKLEEINQSLQMCRDQSAIETMKKVAAEVLVKANESYQENNSADIKALEKLLDEKVTEIGRISFEKLNEAVKNIETTYQVKIAHLEKEIQWQYRHGAGIEQKLNQIDQSFSGRHLMAEQQTSTGLQNSSNDDQLESRSDSTIEMSKKLEVAETATENSPSISEFSPTVQPGSPESGSFSSVDHTRTIDKESAKDDTPCQRNLPCSQDPSEDSTDIRSMSEEEAEEEINLKKVGNVESRMKNITRKDAWKLTEKRMLALGINSKLKSMTLAEMNVASDKICRKREKLKRIYPNFETTREKLKRYVEKLCTPTRKSAVLKRPVSVPQAVTLRNDSYNYQKQLHSPTYSKSADREVDVDSFKKRLEKILDSPVRQPSTPLEMPSSQQLDESVKPIPKPRKRVMFNTQTKISSDNESD